MASRRKPKTEIVSPVPDKDLPDDPLTRALYDSLLVDAETLNDIIASVRWSSCDVSTSVEWFHVLKFLAAFDLWTPWDESTKRENLGRFVEYTHYTDPEMSIEALRATPQYAAIRKSLIQAFADYHAEVPPEEWVERMQGESFRRLAREVIRGKNRQISTSAARDFTDRAMPKVTRAAAEPETGRQVHLPAAVAEGLIESLRMLAGKVGIPRELPEAIDVTPE